MLEIPEVKATIDAKFKISEEYLNKKKEEERKLNERLYLVLKKSELYNKSEGNIHFEETHCSLDSIWNKPFEEKYSGNEIPQYSRIK